MGAPLDRPGLWAQGEGFTCKKGDVTGHLNWFHSGWENNDPRVQSSWPIGFCKASFLEDCRVYSFMNCPSIAVLGAPTDLSGWARKWSAKLKILLPAHTEEPVQSLGLYDDCAQTKPLGATDSRL